LADSVLTTRRPRSFRTWCGARRFPHSELLLLGRSAAVRAAIPTAASVLAFRLRQCPRTRITCPVRRLHPARDSALDPGTGQGTCRMVRTSALPACHMVLISVRPGCRMARNSGRRRCRDRQALPREAVSGTAPVDFRSQVKMKVAKEFHVIAYAAQIC
jgi:hypothetical protein